MIENAPHAPVVIDSASLIVRPEVAVAYKPAPPTAKAAPPTSLAPEMAAAGGQRKPGVLPIPATGGLATGQQATTEKKLNRFMGTVMLSADRPIHHMHQIVDAIIEQLTMLPGAEVSLKLEIDAEVATGFDRAKVRTLIENAVTLGFVDKSVGSVRGEGG